MVLLMSDVRGGTAAPSSRLPRPIASGPAAAENGPCHQRGIRTAETTHGNTRQGYHRKSGGVRPARFELTTF
jgi:hypothetical protein